jgi:hypothetical protein
VGVPRNTSSLYAELLPPQAHTHVEPGEDISCLRKTGAGSSTPTYVAAGATAQ